MTEPSNLSEQLDDLASRLLDRDIEFADVPADLRSAVQMRADEFARHRSMMLQLDDVDGDSIDRAIAVAFEPPTAPRLRSTILGVAAAAVALVIALGVIATTRGGGNDPLTDVADAPVESVAAAMASTPAAESKSVGDVAAVPESVLATPMQTPSVAGTDDVTIIDDTVALEAIAREWSTTPPPLSDQSSTCALAEGSRLVAGSFTFAGQPAEIHYGESGTVVFSLPDCTMKASVAR